MNIQVVDEEEPILESLSLELDETKIQEKIAVDTSERQKFIGGSDVPIILGLVSWNTRYGLYLEKIGEKQPSDLSNVDRVQAGILMEDVIATLYQRKYGKKLRRVNERITCSANGFPQAAQIDRMIVGERIPLEIKNQDSMMRPYWGEEGSSDIAVHYYPQVQHQILVKKAPCAEVAAFFGGNTLVRYVVPRDDAFIVDMIAAEAAFWHCVETRTPPEPIDVEEATLMWSRAPAVKLEGLPMHAELVGFIWDTKVKIKAMENMVEAAKVPIMKALQLTGDTLTLGKASLCSWKPQEQKYFDVDEFEKANPDLLKLYTKKRSNRVFRVLKGGQSVVYDPENIRQYIAPYYTGEANAEAIEEENQ